MRDTSDIRPAFGQAEAPRDTPATRRATRLAFVAAGFVIACWAPLVPVAKSNTGVDEGGLGLLLLCLGAGSMMAMPLTGWLSARIGSRPLIVGGGLGLVTMLPMLVLAPTAAALAVALLVFGAALGCLDVAMNTHAVEVERDSPIPLMSGFHAMFSVGGFAGAGGITLLLWLGLTPLAATLCGSAVTLLAILVAWPGLLSARPRVPEGGAGGLGMIWTNRTVMVLAGLAGVTFLLEGAVLDWGALLLAERDLVDPAQAGIGYMMFAAAMTLGRFAGDRVVARLGGARVLLIGGGLSIAGILCAIAAPGPLAVAGFLMIGLGASNIVPVLFSAAGRQPGIPAAVAVAAVTSVGYCGILMGPAVLGFVARSWNLATAFGLLALLMALVPLASKRVATSET